MTNRFKFTSCLLICIIMIFFTFIAYLTQPIKRIEL